MEENNKQFILDKVERILKELEGVSYQQAKSILTISDSILLNISLTSVNTWEQDKLTQSINDEVKDKEFDKSGRLYYTSSTKKNI